MKYFASNVLVHELAKSLFIKLITGELGEDTKMLKHNCYITAYEYYNEVPDIKDVESNKAVELVS